MSTFIFNNENKELLNFQRTNNKFPLYSISILKQFMIPLPLILEIYF